MSILNKINKMLGESTLVSDIADNPEVLGYYKRKEFPNTKETWDYIKKKNLRILYIDKYKIIIRETT